MTEDDFKNMRKGKKSKGKDDGDNLAPDAQDST